MVHSNDATGAPLQVVSPAPPIARRRVPALAGLTSTVTFPCGNLTPDGSVIKSTAIDPAVVDADGVYRKVLRARVFTTAWRVTVVEGSDAVDVLVHRVETLVPDWS